MALDMYMSKANAVTNAMVMSACKIVLAVPPVHVKLQVTVRTSFLEQRAPKTLGP